MLKPFIYFMINAFFFKRNGINSFHWWYGEKYNLEYDQRLGSKHMILMSKEWATILVDLLMKLTIDHRVWKIRKESFTFW